MSIFITPLADWMTAPDQPYVPARRGDDWFVSAGDEATALVVAGTIDRDLPGTFVALVFDEAFDFAGSGGVIDRNRVREVRYVRRDPKGNFLSVERRVGLAEALDLLPHPEGGWYRETWAAPVLLEPPGYGGSRATATAIYFLLPPGAESCWHQVRSDELWLWHHGGPLELRLGGRGDDPEDSERFILGPDVASGQVFQAVVPGGTWQTARPSGDAEVLVSTIVSPGFDFADFRAL